MVAVGLKNSYELPNYIVTFNITYRISLEIRLNDHTCRGP